MQRPSRGEAAGVAILIAAILEMAFPSSGHGHGAPGTVLLLLLTTALLVEAQPFTFPDRDDVTLTVWPAVLLWYYFGSYIALISTGVAITVVQALRRRPGAGITIAVALVSILLAQTLAAAVTRIPAGVERVFTPHLDVAQQEVTVFCVTFAIAASLLGRLVGDEHPRPELASSLVMAPFAVLLVGLVERRGTAALPLILLAFDAVLVLARSNLAISALHRQVDALARRNEEIARALGMEHDMDAIGGGARRAMVESRPSAQPEAVEASLRE